MAPRKADKPPEETALKAYREKRTADTTPEPYGSGVRARRFVIQKHAARRLHYDLRLEWDGVLHSWAVPKGLSTDPSVKKLAVHTENHPLSYFDFEGVIPAGNYGAGAMIVWDQGLWIPLNPPQEGFVEGKIAFELRGYKARGAWELIRPKDSTNEWLLFKKRDAWIGPAGAAGWTEESVICGLTVEELREGNRRSSAVLGQLEDVPSRSLEARDVELMLAETSDHPFSKEGWIFELKYDGYRVLASKKDGDVHLYYRAGSEAAHIYPSITKTLRSLPYRSLVMDGEVVVLDENALPSFSRLQRRARLSKRPDIERADIELPAVLYLFDLLAVEDRDLRDLPCVRRKELLRQIVPRAGPLRYADHVEVRGEDLYKQVEQTNLEGVIAKKGSAPYRGGRSRNWLKIRVKRTVDLAIVGFSEPKGGRSGFGSLDVAAFDGKEFVYAGRVGTGFDQRKLDDLREALDGMRRDSPACKGKLPSPKGRYWVEPRLVCEVQYTEWTADGLLRHPVFVRLRDDKSPTECLRQPDRVPDEETPIKPHQTSPALPKKVKVTRPHKIFWPEDGFTKGDLVEYYQKVAPALLPYLQDRPVVLTRYPDGIHGKHFFQKDAPDYVPGWVRTERMWSEHAEREIDYFVCEQMESVAYLANLGTIPLHIWSSRVASLARPDWTIIDLDPKEAPFTDVVLLALAFRDLCGEIELPCYVKTSGSSGIHVLVPLGRQCTYHQSRNLAEVLARVVALEHPKIATLVRSLKKREGKVYLDTGQNGHGKLLVSPFSVRPLIGAPVSTPLHWSEVTSDLDLRAYNIVSVPRRLEELAEDPWEGLLTDSPDLATSLASLSERMR